MIFLDETEDLVRIYDREWQCHAEENDRTPTAPGVISPLPPELPSLESFHLSASPTTTFGLPDQHSRPSAINPPVSPHKRRKTAESDDHPGTSFLGSPVAERSALLAQYSPAHSHHSVRFPASPDSVGHGSTFAGIVDQANPFSGQEQLDVNQAEINQAVSSEVQSPTYLELPAWPLTDIREARLMRYFVDHLSTWVSPVHQRTGNNLGSVYQYSHLTNSNASVTV